MKVINLTKNPVILPNGSTIEPSGYISQATYHYEKVGEIEGTPLLVAQVQSVTNIPEKPRKDTMFIVPSVVRLALPDRPDLMSPSKLVRDKAGWIVGCNAFEVNDTYVS
jgi:hypothetical protein